MFGWGKAFKTRGHYVFDYKPRYYDERKERIEKIKAKYENKESEANKPSEDDDINPIVFSKNELRKAWTRTKTKPSETNSTRRLAIIIAILVGIVAYIFDLHHLI